jgi:hypothetical protein
MSTRKATRRRNLVQDEGVAFSWTVVWAMKIDREVVHCLAGRLRSSEEAMQAGHPSCPIPITANLPFFLAHPPDRRRQPPELQYP